MTPIAHRRKQQQQQQHQSYCHSVVEAEEKVRKQSSPPPSPPSLSLLFLPALIVVVFILVVAAPLVSLAQSTPAAAPVRTLCHIPIPDLTVSVLYARFTSQYYQSRFPMYTWRYRYAAALDPRTNSVTPQSAVKGWVVNGSGCDAMIGPGYSFISISVSPLVDIPWTCYFATSTELSDKAAHPAFSRVIPTDEVGAGIVVAAMTHFSWMQIATFCVDEPYGRSVVQGVSQALSDLGGFVERSRCLESSASIERVAAALAALRTARTRVIFLGLLPSSPVFGHIKTVAKQDELHKDTIFFFSEAFCSTSDRTYTEIPGALCGTYTFDKAAAAPFFQSFQATDHTDAIRELASLGFDEATVRGKVGETNVLSALAHDAVLHTMNTLTSYAASGNTSNIYSYLRDQVTEGLTGSVRLQANGDRGSANMALFNAQPSSPSGTSSDPMVEVQVGRIVSGAFQYDSGMSQDNMFLLEQFSTGGVPSHRRPVAATDSSNSGTTVIVVIVVLIFVILGVAVAIVAVVVLTSKKGTRDVTCAPKDSSQPFAMVFTDIQSSTALWARCPTEMGDAIDAHHSLIRTCIAEHKGFEVKTIGDSFMVAFVQSFDAVNFAMAVQRALFKHNWNTPDIDETYKSLLLENGHEVPRDYSKVWNGLRVRIGVHFGHGTIQIDEVQQSYDYYGTVVNTAARVEGVGHGGQTLMSEAVSLDLSRISSFDLTAGIRKASLGEQPLRGLDDPVQLYQLLPEELEERTFPALRLDVEYTVEEAPDSGAGGAGGGNDGATDTTGDSTHQNYITAQETLFADRYARAKPNPIAAKVKYLEQAKFFRTLISTLKHDAKKTMLEQLATSWRTNTKSSKAKTRKDQEDMVNAIVSRVLRAAEAATQQSGMQSALMSARGSAHGVPSKYAANNEMSPGGTSNAMLGTPPLNSGAGDLTLEDH